MKITPVLLLTLSLTLTATVSLAQNAGRGAAARAGGQALPLAAGQRPATPPGLAIKLSTSIKRGDVIARGNRINRAPGGRQDGCDVSFGVETPRFSTGSYTIDLRADEDCVVRVNDIIDNSDAAVTPQAAVAAERPGVLTAAWRGLMNWLMPPLSAAIGPKRITGYTWMYGYGGTWDMLSEERGFHDFTWDGNYVWTNASYGYCEAHNSTFWWMNGCWIYLGQYSGTEVFRKDYGNFFWAPAGLAGPWYYQHQLWNQRNADRFGNAYCLGWSVGSIVYGVAVHCDQAMPPPCGVGVICFSQAPH